MRTCNGLAHLEANCYQREKRQRSGCHRGHVSRQCPDDPFWHFLPIARAVVCRRAFCTGHRSVHGLNVNRPAMAQQSVVVELGNIVLPFGDVKVGAPVSW